MYVSSMRQERPPWHRRNGIHSLPNHQEVRRDTFRVWSEPFEYGPLHFIGSDNTVCATVLAIAEFKVWSLTRNAWRQSIWFSQLLQFDALQHLMLAPINAKYEFGRHYSPFAHCDQGPPDDEGLEHIMTVDDQTVHPFIAQLISDSNHNHILSVYWLHLHDNRVVWLIVESSCSINRKNQRRDRCIVVLQVGESLQRYMGSMLTGARAIIYSAVMLGEIQKCGERQQQRQ